MASTYTSNLGMTKPGTGDLSGTWGNTVNVNSDILDAAINGFVEVSLTGLATYNLTTSQASLSSGQYNAIYLTGSPSALCQVNLVPNTAQKSYLVLNTTNQSIVFTQGTGGNVTIPVGATAIIQSNGAGSGAAVVNVADRLSMSSVTITGGSISGITDLAVADGGTGASSPAGARANLELGTMATQAASAVTITGGTANLSSLSLGGTAITASADELNFVDGVTSSIQTQLGAKAPSASPTLTTPTLSTPTISGTITVSGGTSPWTVIASGVNLTFAYNGFNKMRLDSSGNLIVTGNVTAYNGTIT